MVDITRVLLLVQDALAVKFSELAKQVPAPREELKQVMKVLADRNLVKVADMGEGSDFVLAITADGVKELATSTKNGWR
jgi:hypothetical protein